MRANLPLTKPIVRDWKDLENPDACENFYVMYLLSDQQSYINLRQHYKVRDTDVAIATYPKEGTTWTLEIIRRLKELEYNDGRFITDKQADTLDIGGSSKDQSPWLELLAGMMDSSSFSNFMNDFNNMDQNQIRTMKTHSPLNLILPGIKKIIFVYRNPLDQIVSAWHHHRGKSIYSYSGDFTHFFEEVVIKNQCAENGNWFAYHEEFFKEFYEQNQQDSKEILILSYEKMMIDPETEIKRIAKFCNLTKNLYLNDNLQKITEITSFKSMKLKSVDNGISTDRLSITQILNVVWKHFKNNGIINGLMRLHEPPRMDKIANDGEGSKNRASCSHIRKGVVGDYVNYFSEVQLAIWSDFVQENLNKYPYCLKYCGIDYLNGKNLG